MQRSRFRSAMFYVRAACAVKGIPYHQLLSGNRTAPVMRTRRLAAVALQSVGYTVSEISLVLKRSPAGIYVVLRNLPHRQWFTEKAKLVCAIAQDAAIQSIPVYEAVHFHMDMDTASDAFALESIQLVTGE